MKTLHVDLGENAYDIHIENGLLRHAGPLIRQLYDGNKVCIVSDQNVWNLYATKLLAPLAEEGIQAECVVLPPGEETKQLIHLEQVYDTFAHAGITRSDLVIAFGGGVIGDLGGFAAATYMRGIDYIQIPTTLLAQVDASVGGKTAVNLKAGKNLVGAFHQPKMVITDTSLLTTLSNREFASGMSEVIKYAAIRSTELYDILDKYENRNDIMEAMDDIVMQCCDIKRILVEADQFDKGERMLLNFGHTFGHAIEKLGDYTEHTHGEAVAIGMVLATKLGSYLGVTEPLCSNQLEKLIKKYGLSLDMPYALAEMLAPILHDKKNLNNSINWIFLNEIGESTIHPIDSKDVESLIIERSAEWMI